jgi:multisubunit Na+/H+ antiporter MnhG subunit
LTFVGGDYNFYFIKGRDISMDINVLSFAGYFILYLFIGFVFFNFTMFKKPGSNTVGTICIMLVFISLAVGFLSALHVAIINLFILLLSFWFAYIVMKMYYDDKKEQERQKASQERAYQRRVKRQSNRGEK